jgi:hypothetical protein
MANIKFSAFTSEAVDASNTRIVGYVNGTTKNTQYTIAEIATGLASSLPTIYSADSSLAAARTVTMGTYNLAFASSTAGQEVSFGQNTKISGQGYTELYDTANTTLTVNWNNGNVQELTGLTGSLTFTASNPKVGATYILTLAQTGTVTPTWTGIKWPAATAPTLSGAGKTDVITLICYDATGAGLYYGSSTLNFTT